MAILKTSHHTEYTPMPQQAEVTFAKDFPQNGRVPAVVTQTYVDAATAQVKKSDRGMENEGTTGNSEDQNCGWGPFSPRICQRFRNPKWICFWLCWAGAIQVWSTLFLYFSKVKVTTSIEVYWENGHFLLRSAEKKRQVASGQCAYCTNNFLIYDNYYYLYFVCVSYVDTENCVSTKNIPVCHFWSLLLYISYIIIGTEV